MIVSKIAGAIMFPCIVGLLLGESSHAQNSVRSAESASVEAPLPKDIYPDSRNRLPLPNRDDMDNEGKDAFDELTRKSELPIGIEQPGVRLWDPQLARPMGEVSHYLKYEIGLPARLLEIAVLITAREMDCEYEWTQWETHGRDPKDPRHIEPAIIDIIKYEKPVTGLGEKETAVIAFGRETFGQRKVSSETFAEVLRLFGRKGTVDLLELMAGYSADAAELTAFDNHLRADQKPLLPPATHPRNPERFAAAAADPLPKDLYPDSRSRMPSPKREDMDDEGKKIFDEVTRGRPLPNGASPAGFLPTGTPQASVRLWDPRLAQLISEVSHYRKYETGLSDRLLEIAILVTAYEMECQYEWTQWERFGRNPADPRHIEQSTIDIIKYNKPVSGLGEKEAAIIAFGRETFGQRKLSSETFADVLRLFGRKGTVDLLELMAGYSADAAELTAFDQQLQIGQTPLLPPR
jgi:4-carboxymuconolactone decarboxylase